MNLLADTSFTDHLSSLTTRWENALDANGFPAVLVRAGASQNYFMDDQAPPFRANPHFAQWFPERACEHCELLVRPGRKPLVLFYQPEDYWHLPPSVPSWASESFEIEQHSSLDALAQARNSHLKGVNGAACIGAEPITGKAGGQLQHNPQNLISHLDYLRDQKTLFEVAAMREATQKAVAGHNRARDAFFAGGSEYQIYMAFLAATGNTGGELPYSSIVALNEHCGVLHYQYYDQELPGAHLSFLIDAGASHLGYASDITRTYASNQAPEEFAALITALNTAQLELISRIRIDTAYAEIHGQMIDRIAELLCEHAIITCSADEAKSKGYADPFMPHGLGHLIGLQTHDVGGHLANISGDPSPPDERFPALRLTRALRANSVFTIEPGIYFIPMLLNELRATNAPINWKLVDQLIPCGGIRIEDNIWLTEDGPVNLTREAFDAI